MDLKEELILGASVESHWYYKSKAEAMRTYVPLEQCRNVLDVGAGSGFFTRYLLKTTAIVKGTCVDTGYPREWDETVNGKALQFRRSSEGSQPDLVLLMDVLEHLDNDRALLSEYVERMKSGSFAFITVPAFQFLWSGHDVFLEHRRRYTIQSVEKLVQAAGLRPVRSSYYFGLVFPLAVARRLGRKLLGNQSVPSSDLQRHSSLVNAILAGVSAIERPLLRFNRLAGLSVFHLAMKS